jgi:hypothetical protein
MYKESILVVYPPGGYGTFLEWCLNYFTGAIAEDTIPFTSNGSSHLFAGNALDVPVDLAHFPNSVLFTTEEYFSNKITYPVIRCHGYLNELQKQPGYTVKKYIDTIINQVPAIVLLTVPENARLLTFGNSITKTKMFALVNGTFDQRVIAEFKTQFGVLDDHDVPTWQLREMISYWHERYLTSSVVEPYQPVLDSKVINISIRDLVDNFEKTLITLFESLGLVLQRQHLIVDIKQRWLPLQQFLNSDQKCQDIITNVLAQTDYNWEPLHLHEEAYIQWQLRDLHGLDLLCYDVNTFPTNTNDLGRLLISV